MTKFKTILSIFILCILSVSSVYADDIFKRRDNITIFFNLKPENCPREASDKISKEIRDRLPGVSYLYLFPEDKVISATDSYRDCFDSHCAARLGKRLKCHRVITGSIKRTVREETEPLGDTGKERYLLKIIKKISFTIKLQLYNIEDDRIMVSLEETCKAEDTDETLNKLMDDLQDYYTPRDLGLKPVYALSLYFSSTIPHGSFQNSTRAGFGYLLDFGVTNIFAENITLHIATGYQYFLSNNESIEQFHQLNISIYAGYTFPVHSKFYLSPMLGGGYLFHIIDGDNSEIKIYGLEKISRTIYHDPFISILCELGYKINDHFHLLLTPGYSVFFEQNNIGLVVNLNLGAKYKF